MPWPPAPWWWKLIAPHRRTLALGLAATVLCSAAASAVPYWAGRAVSALERHSWSHSRTALLWMMAFTLLAGLGRYFMRQVLIGLSRRVERIQREEIFHFLLKRPFGFFERQRTGDLMAREGDDVSTVRMALGPGLMGLFTTLSILPATLLLMFRTSPRLTLAVLAPFLLLALAFYGVGRGSHALQQRLQLLGSQLNTFSHETISGEQVVQAFGLEAQRVEAFRALSRRQARLQIRQSVLSGAYGPLSALTGGLAALLLVSYGGRLVVGGALGLGDLTAFTGYLAALAWPVMSMGWAVNLFQRGRAGQERIDQLLEAPEVPLPDSKTMETYATPPSVQARELVYRYESGRGVGPLDCHVPPGGSLALVGGIGSGKTLLLQLLAGLRPPGSGAVLVEGRRLEDRELRKHWRSLGWVPQEAFLFSASLRENLTLGRPNASREEVMEAVRTACLDGLVARLPGGLDTVVGERGVILSGGERQRAALARALLGNPKLLLLDDALSAVDADTESQILGHLRARLGRMTLVLATHRIFVAELCDQVLVLEEGLAAQAGTPAELGEIPGPFARMKRLQSLERELAHPSAT